MDIETLARSTAPDFMDLDISSYSEEKDGDEREVVQVRGEHNGEMYGFEITGFDDEVPEGVVVSELRRFYSLMIEKVIEDELDSGDE